MAWRGTDRSAIAQIMGYPIDQDRPRSRLDRRMQQIFEDDLTYGTNYVLAAQNIVDQIQLLPPEESLDDYGVTQASIPQQILISRTGNSSLIQLRQRRTRLVGELSRILGIAASQGYTLRS